MEAPSQSTVPLHRKRDTPKHFYNWITRVGRFRQVHAETTTSLSAAQQTPRSSTDAATASVNIPSIPDTQMTEGMAALGISESQVVQKKSFEKDIAVLSATYLFADRSDLKRVISLIMEIYEMDEGGKLVDVLEICAKFTVQLGSVSKLNPEEGAIGIRKFVQTLEQIKIAYSRDNSQSGQDWRTLVDRTIRTIKTSHPLFDSGGRTSGENLPKLLDTVIGAAITVFDILKDASELVPVPLVRTVVSSVATLLNAVDQTRSNFNDMKRIAAAAGKFVVSLAVTCAFHSANPPRELARALEAFTLELQGIAQECEELSHMNPCRRFLEQNNQRGDLQVIKTKLDDAIELFQAKSHVNIEFKLQDMNEKIDHLALSNLPEHPRYNVNDYMEGSRRDVIADISDWIGTSIDVVLWMHGAAGLGKSTVCQQLVKLLEADDRLAGGVFMTLQAGEHPTRVIEMLSKQIGQLHPRAVSNIVRAAREVQGVHKSLRDYLTAYIMEPVRALNYPYQLVIIVDGVEEWKNYEAFLKELEHLPSPCPVKFILTSRPNRSIERLLGKVTDTVRQYLLPPVPKEVIKEYFKHHFKDVEWRGRRPDEKTISRLANLADGLLIWAATVCSLLSHESDERYPHQILDEILRAQEKVGIRNREQLGQLYEEAIERLFQRSDIPEMRNRFGIFIGAMLVIQESLPIRDFAVLLDIPERPVEEIQRRLTALQTRGDVRVDFVVPAIQRFHASCVEFFSSHVSPKDANISSHHAILARNSLQAVFTDLLPSYQGRSCRFSGLSKAEAYAVKFWPFHFSSGGQWQRSSGGLIELLENIPEESMHRWASLFLSSFSIEDESNSLGNTSKSELLYLMAEILKAKGTGTHAYQIYLLEVSARLSDEMTTWEALGEAYGVVYRCGGRQQDLDAKVEAFRRALELAQTWSHPERPKSLGNLAEALRTRFQQRGAFDDLTESICLSREALELHTPSHPGRSLSLNNLAGALRICFEQRGSPDYLAECISFHKEAIELCPPHHPDRSSFLGNFAASLITRFQQQGSPDDLAESISLSREALELCPPHHPDHSKSLNYLANSLGIRFEEQGSSDDLSESISLYREALELRPAFHPERFVSLNNLASALLTRFEGQGSPDDLVESICLHREAFELLSAYHPGRSLSLNNLAEALRIGFEHQGSPDDLSESISLHREALKLRRLPHPERSSSLNNLANSLRVRFEQQGSPDDLSEFISLFREAHELLPAYHPERSKTLNNLANALRVRFEQQGSPDDLSESIFLHREALGLCPPHHPDRPMSLNNLANALLTCFKEQGSPDDLVESIRLHRDALKLLPACHPGHFKSLNNLANALRIRFEFQGSPVDLDEAISFYQQILECPSQNRSQHLRALNEIPSALRQRYSLRGNKSDLDEAIHWEEVMENED